MDRRCPEMHMFEVDCKTGKSNAQFNSHLNNEAVMEMKFSDFYNPSNQTVQYNKSDIEMRQNPSFPANGFTLNVAIRYSNEFANAFGSSAENTYVSNSFLILYHYKVTLD